MLKKIRNCYNRGKKCLCGKKARVKLMCIDCYNRMRKDINAKKV